MQVTMVNGYQYTIGEETERNCNNSRLIFRSASWEAEGNKQVYLNHMWVLEKNRIGMIQRNWRWANVFARLKMNQAHFINF